MRHSLCVLLLSVTTLFLSCAANAQTATPTLCPGPVKYPVPVPTEVENRIIDARPGQPSNAKGKSQFNRKGTVFIVNLNPFLFDYVIKVKEEKIDESATVLKFAKLLAPVISDFTESSRAESSGFSPGKAGAGKAEIYLEPLLPLLAPSPSPSPTCGADANANSAIDELNKMKQEILNRLKAVKTFLDTLEPASAKVRNAYIDAGQVIYDPNTTTEELCNELNCLLLELNGYASSDEIAEQLTKIEEAKVLADELKDRVGKFKALYPNCDPKIQGYSYMDSLLRLAAVTETSLGPGYRTRLEAIGRDTQTFSAMRESIEYLSGKETELLQKSFLVGGKFDYSRAAISVTPVPRAKDGTIGGTQARTSFGAGGDESVGNSSSAPSTGSGINSEPSTGNPSAGGSSVGNFRNEFAAARSEADPPKDDPKKQPEQIKDEVIIGRPRFEISAGLVYSPLAQPEYQAVTGFARDREGNLTNGTTETQIVGFSERSSRRLLPIGMLHTRLTNFPNYNLYFSLGITAKKSSASTDVEYLVGPSVNLSDRIFLTVGGYAGKQQQLAGDLFTGAELPEGVDDTPVIKKYRWKLGLAFSYRLPLSTGSTKASGEESDQITDEVIIGQPRFVMSAGMAYSSLPRRQFQTVIGFARDRDGNLTNGETLTKIVGFKESSPRRVLPMGMLSTRLTSFRDYNLYFSLGITAKRTDSSTDVEYLLGPSFSFLKNQLLFTAGAYAGRQQRLGGDIFINEKLPQGGSITTQNEYTFKPGFAFTYRIPVRMP